MVTLYRLKQKFNKLGKIAMQHSMLVSEFHRLESEFFEFVSADERDIRDDDIISGHFLGENPCDFLYYLDKMEKAMDDRHEKTLE